MKILTLNTWGTNGPPARMAVLLEALRSLQPEILCLQEAADVRWLTQLTLAAGYASCLHASESGVAILSKFPVAAQFTHTYSARSPLESYLRQALGAELQIGSLSLWMVTTHLAWREEDEPTRLAQAQELLSRIGPLGDRILLSGDFNAAPQTAAIARIREAGFLDLFGHLHPQELGITWDNRNPFIQSHSVIFPDRRIDYLFLHQNLSRQLVPARCEVACSAPSAEGLYPSDHYGVLGSFRLE